MLLHRPVWKHFSDSCENAFIMIYLYIYVYIEFFVTNWLCGFLAKQVWYNLESAQYLR